ncbi:carbonic anhydrase family protein [Vagococcus salmoninarum]|uniref:carbonic anhydrase family protein n=1 Tax=Vagococcus salmoninarum TaxID=2739 RepID=UPI0028D12B24|nr:carbonic anhydrase family protein [Vagococcus salmoninarum]
MGVKRIYAEGVKKHSLGQQVVCCDLLPDAGLYHYQSPVDFSTLPKVQTDSSLALTFDYQKQVFEQAIFANAFHLVPKEKKSRLSFEEEDFWLIDIHVHFPSEHMFDNRHTEFEFHFVHENAEGNKLVVALLFDLTDEKFLVKNELRRFAIMSEFSAKADMFFNPVKYLPKEKTFYHFIGSLTTPPFNGPVLWFVMDTVQLANREIVEKAKKEIPVNNNRPVYPLKDRTIWHN